MRIDVHTHIWPDRIAPAVLENMTGTFGYPAVGINTVDGIKEHMRASGVDKAVVLGVVKRLDHLPGANDWLISIQDDMLVPFGAMHPDLEDKASEVRRMRDAGIKGFKLHPMVNSYYPDDPRMFPFYEEMGDDMVVEIHSGRWAHTQPGDTIWADPGADHERGPAVPQAEADRPAPGRVLHAGRSGAGAHRAGERADRHHMASGAEGAGQRDAGGDRQPPRC